MLVQAVYDATGEKGLLDWSASYDAGEQYKTDITGYNDAYQPTQMVITVPTNSHTSGLTGSYTYTTSYRVDGTPVSETYPAVGGLPAERVTYGNAVTGEALWTSGQDLDGAGSPTGSPHTYVSSATYDTIGRLTARRLGDTSGVSPNVNRGYSYDSLGRLNALTANFQFGTGTPTALQSTAYAFDANNNVASRQDAIGGQVECFSYDSRNRLTRAYTSASCAGSLQDTPGPNPYERTYTFDAASRMTSMASRTAVAQSLTTRTYSYATTSPGGCTAGTAASKPHAPSSVTDYSFGYDCAGNATARTTPSASFTQAWDAQGRLAQVVKAAGATGNYIYGPDGQRLIQEDGTTRTVYLPRQEVVSVNGATATAARYYGAGGATVAARRTGANAGNYFMGGDNQGSVSWMINTATGAASSSRYYPYGEVRGTPNQMPTDHGFVGQIEDDTTALSYLNYRYYDPTTAVFMSVDPLVAETGQPYIYAGGDPATFSDSNGLCMIRSGMHTYDNGLPCASGHGAGGAKPTNELGSAGAADGPKPTAECDGLACKQRINFTIPRIDGAGQVYVGAYIAASETGGPFWSSLGDNRQYFEDPGDCSKSRACLWLDFTNGTGSLTVNYSCSSDGCYDAWPLGSDENNVAQKGDGRRTPFSLEVHATNAVTNSLLGTAPLSVDFGVEVMSDGAGGGYVDINLELFPSYEYTLFGNYYARTEVKPIAGIPIGLELKQTTRYFWVPPIKVGGLPSPLPTKAA